MSTLEMSERRRFKAKLVIAIILDLVDFTIGRVLGVGLVSNLILTLAGVGLFGWRGLFHLLEFLDPTHQIDGFVPTLTLIALTERGRNQSDG